MIHATSMAQLTKVLQANRLTLVYFTAPWCGPCKAMGPMVDTLLAEFKGSVAVLAVDVAESPGIAQAYDVRAVPHVAMFCWETQWEAAVGLQTLGALQRMVKTAIQDAASVGLLAADLKNMEDDDD